MPCETYDPIGEMRCRCGAMSWEHPQFRKTTPQPVAAVVSREQALSDVELGAGPLWNVRALAIVKEIAERQAYVTSDDVWRTLEDPGEPRALGAVFRRAAEAGYLKVTTRTVPSTAEKRHRRPIRVWKSLIYVAPVSPPVTQSDLWE